jgi:monoterpene epsilon-lactone hydrolase
MTRSPGAMSVEAAALLAAYVPPDPEATRHLSMDEVRARTRAAYAPAAEQAVARNGVRTAEVEIGGVRCMTVTPGDRAAVGTVLYLFGGGFMLGSPFEDLPITAALAAKTGARIVAPWYRLAPEHPFPAGLDDAFAVARALARDGAPFCLAGESAGGNLVLALAHRMRRLDLPGPSAIAALSPAADKTDYGDSGAVDRDPFLKLARTSAVNAAYVPGMDATDPEISPVYGPFDATFPPTIVTTGTRDLLLSSAVKLARVMREAGAPVDLRVWEGMWHVFEFYSDIPEAEASLTEIAEFLNPYL